MLRFINITLWTIVLTLGGVGYYTECVKVSFEPDPIDTAGNKIEKMEDVMDSVTSGSYGDCRYIAFRSGDLMDVVHSPNCPNEHCNSLEQ